MNSSITARIATADDCREIWEWWNDSVTRKMMRKNDPVPWEEHAAWFEAVLVDSKRVLCVGMLGDEKLGVIRFDLRKEFEYEVSINLNPAYRGKGYAPIILKKAIALLLSKKKVVKLWAGCKKINAPSRKTFERAGFVLKPHPDYEPLGEQYCEWFVPDATF